MSCRLLLLLWEAVFTASVWNNYYYYYFHFCIESSGEIFFQTSLKKKINYIKTRISPRGREKRMCFGFSIFFFFSIQNLHGLRTFSSDHWQFGVKNISLLYYTLYAGVCFFDVVSLYIIIVCNIDRLISNKLPKQKKNRKYNIRDDRSSSLVRAHENCLEWKLILFHILLHFKFNF